MKPCFGYIRVSTQKQGEGVSLEAQKEAIEAFASHHQLTVTNWFEEKETAAKSGRPIFSAMLKQLKQGKAQGVIIHKIDRSARNLKDWALFSELPDAGVSVYVATESLDFNSRGGRLTADIQAVIAADYIRNLREECIKGLNGRLKQGLYPFRAPIGYLDNGRGNPKTLDPRKAPLIREMFELYAGGHHSLRTLQAVINRRGLRNLNGMPLSLHGVETILNNTFYTGLITISRTGATYPGTHEPLITTDLFQRVQRRKAGRSGPKVTRHNHLFAGLFRCANCDGPMSPELQKQRCYYRCQRTECPTKTIREDRLDALIRSHLKKLKINAIELEALKAANAQSVDKDASTQRVKALKLQLSDENRRLERLADLVIDGCIDRQTFRDRQAASQLRIRDLKEQLSQVPDWDEIIQARSTLLELQNSLVFLYESGDRQEKRDIVENVFSNRRVAGKNAEMSPYSWLERRQNTSSVLQGEPQRHTDRTLDHPVGLNMLLEKYAPEIRTA